MTFNNDVWILYAAFCAFVWSVMTLRGYLMLSSMPKLMQGSTPAALPKLSVIVPARDEAKTIRKALSSLLAQDYPNLEIVLINDRSADETPNIMDELAATDARLKVIHLDSLPDGWLGKNHANQKGYERSTGDYILFTDADVIFESDTLTKTVAYALTHNAKHIVAYPTLLTEDIFEETFIALFGFLFTWKFSPSGAKNPKNKKAYIGVGAFNFIQRKLYQTIGEHTRLRHELADDVKLGYWVKQYEEATHVVRGTGQVSVRWREGLWDSLKAVERSAFPGINYSWTWVIIGVIGTLFGLIAPYWLLAVPNPMVQLLAGISLVMIFLGYFGVKRQIGKTLAITLLHPVMSVLFMYALVRSAVIITQRGGMEWRGTFYPLRVLKSGATS
jgi:glycosyltransferase involved in cell wall biosynthesis